MAGAESVLNGSLSSPTEVGPVASCSSMRRRVG